METGNSRHPHPGIARILNLDPQTPLTVFTRLDLAVPPQFLHGFIPLPDERYLLVRMTPRADRTIAATAVNYETYDFYEFIVPNELGRIARHQTAAEEVTLACDDERLNIARQEMEFWVQFAPALGE